MAIKIINAIYTLISMISLFHEPTGISEKILNISDYNYPLPLQLSTDSEYKIAIFGTNDIHGSVFPMNITNSLTNETYGYGGLQYLSPYINTLRKDWGDRLLWLDGGDQFQGKIESKISNGSIITDFFNIISINASAIGNHEWDYNQQYLKDRLTAASWKYLAANIQNTTNNTEFLPNTKVAQIFQVGEIKIGVIGLSTVETPFTTAGDLTGIKFVAYLEVVTSLSKLLREQGANAVVLAAHIGMRCQNDLAQKMILKMRNKYTYQAECELQDEIQILLRSLDEGVIDAVVGGHVHDVVHHWVNDIPIIQSINGGFYSHVMYLTFDKATKKIIREKTEIEGPLPTCEKVFENTRRCDFVTKHQAEVSGKLQKFSFHGVEQVPDQNLVKSFAVWWDQVSKYKVSIGHTEVLLQKGNNDENPFGNLFTDAIKFKTNADVVFFNDGAIRNAWYPGNLNIEDVWNVCPFDNLMVTFDMRGAELKKALLIVQSSHGSFYHTSGLLQNMTLYPKKLISVKLFDGSDIIDDKVYKIGSIDFLLNGGDDFKDVISWYKPKNVAIYGLLRDYIIEYVSTKANYIKDGDFIDPNHKRINIVPGNLRRFWKKLNVN